jgi:protein gp37
MRVFVGSMMDWAEDHPQLDPWREEMWALIRESTWIRFQLLTKRADRIAKCLPPDWGEGYKNVWLGVSVEDQEWADKRIPHLLNVPAAVRFISYEPALASLDLERYLWGTVSDTAGYFDRNGKERSGGIGGQTITARPQNLLHLAIQGGESGPNFRPMDMAWARSLRDQCVAAGVAYFFKQQAAFRSGTRPYIEETDGSKWVWKQYPGDLKPPERVE